MASPKTQTIQKKKPLSIVQRISNNNQSRVFGAIDNNTCEDNFEQAVPDDLQISEIRYRRLFEAARDGILILDAITRKITDVNPFMIELLGYTREEFLGKELWEIGLLKDEEESIAAFQELQKNKYIRYEDLPLRDKNGENREVEIVSNVYQENGRQVVQCNIRDITKRKEFEKQLLHDAFHDSLTSLANRSFFTECLQMTIERTKRDRSELFAVLFLDFDRFKVINDSLGHAEGDNLLKQIARRLESTLRSGDLVARLGGDEFTILVNKLGDSSVASLIAEHLQKNLEIPFKIGGGEIFISASIGIALSTTGYEQAEDMLRDADIAMYRAKAKGKAQYQVFDTAMHEQALSELRIETEMRQSIEREEFLLYYQPIINLKTETLIGFEALVRWQHETRGMILPNEYISIAEENGLIIPLGQWILHESCRQLRHWQENNPAASGLTVSVNLSSKQFLQFNLAEQIAESLKKTGLNPHCLKLEITESHIMENSEIAAKTMRNLCVLGVELSLDDFGTGYSSLSYLHRLPVSYLKIDRSFVNRMIDSKENSEIVHTIIKLARNLKMKVVAEGIETAEQLAQLKKLNCEYGQGYFFARPMEADAAEIYIDKSLKNPAYLSKQSVIN
ncbi:MAG: EAL domain-containing protein [Actinomycetota bacterium]